MNKKNITIRDIAKEAGVSIASVSRYMNNVSYTGPETKKKIQKAMDKFDYTPNATARGLAKQKSNTIALITPDITNPFFPELVKSINKIASDNGYKLILINTTENELEEKEFWKDLKSNYIDGIIIAESGTNINTLTLVKELNIPFIQIDRAVKLNGGISITVDNFKGAQLAVRHLIDIGCKKIAHIAGPSNLYPAANRLSGYIDIIKELGQDPLVSECDFTLEGGKSATEKLLEEHPDIDGIFYANDLMAIGSLKYFHENGINVPNDIALIGFDDIKMAKIVTPEISTIRQPVNEIGEIAIKQLISLIETPSKNARKNHVLEVELIVRESTRINRH